MTEPVVGILGAGRAGTALARAMLRAGIGVDICSTRSPKALRHHLKIYAPGAAAVWPDEVAQRTKSQGPAIVVLAVPQEELDDVDPAWVADTVLVDATNRWHDELLPSWLQAGIDEQLPTSMVIAGRFGAGSGAGGGSGVRLVKALNHIAHHDVESSATPELPLEQRRAAAVAADDDDARGRVMGLLVRMGLDPVSVGALPAGRIMEPDGPLFNRPLRREDILRYLR